MIDEDEMIEINKKKISYYFEKHIAAHITLKTNRWVNGYVKEVSAEFFILDEFVDGELIIFYQEIAVNGIQTFTKERREK